MQGPIFARSHHVHIGLSGKCYWENGQLHFLGRQTDCAVEGHSRELAAASLLHDFKEPVSVNVEVLEVANKSVVTPATLAYEDLINCKGVAGVTRAD